MAQHSPQGIGLRSVRPNIHRTDWRQSITRQLQLRKSVEQAPFEEICSFASSLFDKVDICKTENIQLNLQREQLQQQLLNIQQTILAGGSGAAKTILSKISSSGLADDASDLSSGSTAAKNLGLQHAALLAEKSQLEKKLLDIQEKLADTLKSKSDTVQMLVDLRTDLDAKERHNRELLDKLKEREAEVVDLNLKLKKLEERYKDLTDEHQALTLCCKGLEKKNYILLNDFEALTIQVRAAKQEDADRLNAENERIIAMQQERKRKEIEAKVGELNQTLCAKQAAGDLDNFECLDDEDALVGLLAPSKIPTKVLLSFDAHDGETCAVNWYCCSGPRDDFLATGGSDRKVKLWKITQEGNASVAVLLGSNASITSIDVEADAILASSNDYATRIWSVTDFKSRRTLTGHSAKVLSAKFLGAPHRVASGSQDRTIKIWDVTQGACQRTYFAGSSCFDLAYNDYQVISGHFDSKIRCWDLKKPNDNESVAQIVLPSKITSLDTSRDGTKLLCSLRDNTIKCLDLRRLEVLQTYSDEKFRIGSDSCRAKFSIDGQHIMCGSNDGSVYIWDSNSAKVESILTAHNTTVLAGCWSPDGQKLVSIERGKKVSIWS